MQIDEEEAEQVSSSACVNLATGCHMK